jgi:cobalt-precorrin-7 (C5)-methyltransferase
VVGIGPGNKEFITSIAKDTINQASLLIGARRHLNLYEKKGVRCIEISGRIDEIISCIDENSHENIVVLASGDPLLFGIGTRIRQAYKDVKIISGISSLQYIFTKIPVDMNDVYFTSTHGRNVDFGELKNHKKIAMVTDKINHPGVIASKFIGEDVRVYIGTNLGYKDETVVSGKPENFTDFKVHGLHVVVITSER